MIHIPEWLNNFVHDTGAYFFCVIGVLMSHYIPEYRVQGTVDLSVPVIGELAVATDVSTLLGVIWVSFLKRGIQNGSS